MKTRYSILIAFLLFAFAGFSQQASEKRVQTAVIKTKIYCDHCKICESCGGRILKQLYNEDGIKTTEVDAKTNTIKVVYDTKKISVEKIRTLISQLGFDADNVPADPKAVAKLDDCCQKPS